jgi:hypothetical protein
MSFETTDPIVTAALTVSGKGLQATVEDALLLALPPGERRRHRWRLRAARRSWKRFQAKAR